MPNDDDPPPQRTPGRSRPRTVRRMRKLLDTENWPRDAAAAAFCHLLAKRHTTHSAVTPPPVTATVMFAACAAACGVCGRVTSACTLPSLNTNQPFSDWHLTCNTAAAAYHGDEERLLRLLRGHHAGFISTRWMIGCARSPACARALLPSAVDAATLIAATHTNTATAVAVLQDHGAAHSSLTTPPLLTIIMGACRAGRVGVLGYFHNVRRLPVVGAINANNSWFRYLPASPLHAAADAGQAHVLAWFIATYDATNVRIPADMRDRTGRRPLDIAAERGHTACVERLLALGPAIGRGDCYNIGYRLTPVPAPGFGAIQRAALRRRPDVLKVLLQRLRESAPGDYDACVDALRGCGVAPIVETCAAVLP